MRNETELIERMMGNFRNPQKRREIPITTKNSEKCTDTKCTKEEKENHSHAENHSCCCKKHIDDILCGTSKHPGKNIVLTGDEFWRLNDCDIIYCTISRDNTNKSNCNVLSVTYNVSDIDVMGIVSDLINGKNPDVHLRNKDGEVIHSDFFTTVLSYVTDTKTLSLSIKLI